MRRGALPGQKVHLKRSSNVIFVLLLTSKRRTLITIRRPRSTKWGCDSFVYVIKPFLHCNCCILCCNWSGCHCNCLKQRCDCWSFISLASTNVPLCLFALYCMSMFFDMSPVLLKSWVEQCTLAFTIIICHPVAPSLLYHFIHILILLVQYTKTNYM